MNEVTKLYENARIEPVCDGIDCGTCTAECNNGKYPEFTAEKQLEILIALANYNLYEEDKRLMIDSFNGEVYIGFYRDTDLIANATDKEFSKCVAKLINSLWQSLTEAERKQVKGILE